MTKDIKRAISSLIQASQRMIGAELPKIAAILRKFDEWIANIVYRELRGMSDEQKEAHQTEMISKLQDEIEKIKKQ